MYKMKPGVKQDPQRRWALPDRVFFGYGACHILAGVYLLKVPLPGFYAEHIVPSDGFAGHHVFVTNGRIAFDFHGYSMRDRLVGHHTRNWAGSYSEGWNCAVERVDFDLLNTADLNARKMRGPDQYRHDPRPRARAYLARIDHGEAAARALLRHK